MSMQRSIRRSMAKNQGTFEAKKPLRTKSHVSIKDMLLKALRGIEIQRKSVKSKKEVK